MVKPYDFPFTDFHQTLIDAWKCGLISSMPQSQPQQGHEWALARGPVLAGPWTKRVVHCYIVDKQTNMHFTVF